MPTAEHLPYLLRGAAAYGLSWFDAYLWAYAEACGIPEILSEDFEHGRHYGGGARGGPVPVGRRPRTGAAASVQRLKPLTRPSVVRNQPQSDSPPHAVHQAKDSVYITY
jgi:hypothetical protein